MGEQLRSAWLTNAHSPQPPTYHCVYGVDQANEPGPVPNVGRAAGVPPVQQHCQAVEPIQQQRQRQAPLREGKQAQQHQQQIVPGGGCEVETVQAQPPLVQALHKRRLKRWVVCEGQQRALCDLACREVDRGMRVGRVPMCCGGKVPAAGSPSSSGVGLIKCH